RKRDEFLGMLNIADLTKTIADAATSHFDVWFAPKFDQMAPDEAKAETLKAFKEAGIADALTDPVTPDDFRKIIEEKSVKVAEHQFAKNNLVGILDMLWMTNLEDLEALQESVGLRAYGQRDPLVEYRH